jgi:hypothetical protein
LLTVAPAQALASNKDPVLTFGGKQ